PLISFHCSVLPPTLRNDLERQACTNSGVARIDVHSFIDRPEQAPACEVRRQKGAEKEDKQIGIRTDGQAWGVPPTTGVFSGPILQPSRWALDRFPNASRR